MTDSVLHVELTNRCTLFCPSCPRTIFNDIKKLEKKDLNIDDFYRFLDCPGGKQIDRLILCGDYGDSIYYPHLIDFIKKFRHSKTFSITTNGSRQTEKFWKSLTDNLNKNDTIRFAIDGLKDDNALYRKNSNWDSIINGLNIVSQSEVNIEIQTIVFKFNYNKLNDIADFAASYGATHEILRSHRFDNAPDLVPPENKLIETHFLYKSQYNENIPISITPRCLKEKVVTCDGYFFPCDWIRSPYTFYKSQLHKQKERWIDKLNIKNTNFDAGIDIIKDWANFVKESGIHDPKNVSVLCKMKCRSEM